MMNPASSNRNNGGLTSPASHGRLSAEKDKETNYLKNNTGTSSSFMKFQRSHNSLKKINNTSTHEKSNTFHHEVKYNHEAKNSSNSLQKNQLNSNTASTIYSKGNKSN